MSKKVAFRVDSSSLIGGGHIFRCIYLAKILKQKGYEILFISKNIKGNINHIIRKNNFKIKILPKRFYDKRKKNFDVFTKKEQLKESEYLKKFLKNFDIIIIDHYGVNYIWEKNLGFSGKLVVISDLVNKKHFCDVYINFHINDRKKIKNKILKKNCKFLLGKKYILIGEARKQNFNLNNNLFSRRKRNILLFFGTTDSNDYMHKVLKLFQNLYCGSYNIISILGQNYKHKKNIKIKFNKLNNVKIVDGKLDFKYFKEKIFFSIGVYSQSFFEKIFYSIPTINLISKKNMNFNRDIQDSRFIRFIKKINLKDIHKFSSNITDHQFNGKKIIDGKGAQRITKKIIYE